MDDPTLAARLKACSQDHLLRWWDELPPPRQEALRRQIESIDLAACEALWCAASGPAPKTSGDKAAPPENVIPAGLPQRHAAAHRRAVERGERALRDGRVGAVLVAGGEGTRLDFPQPKGMFPIAPVSGKTLFQWLAEQLQARGRRCRTVIPWYVMTSDRTHDQTQAFFEENGYFGLDPDDVYFFPQGNMPAVDRATGQVLMSARDELCLAPNGHGGLLEAMLKAGLFDDMRDRGIEHLFYHQVDNPLLRMCDPAFLGFHLLGGAEVSTKVVRRTDPHEKVGLVVDVEGRQRIIEYSDLPPDLAARRDPAGQLYLWAGNTAIHLFEREFLERVARDQPLPYHAALKRVPHLDPQGQSVRPESENALKFERFIFDTLPLASRTVVVEVLRDEEFTPLKNRSGAFSPEHVQAAMRRTFTAWLRHAGLTAADDLPLEIGPLVALDQQELADKLATPAPRREAVAKPA